MYHNSIHIHTYDEMNGEVIEKFFILLLSVIPESSNVDPSLHMKMGIPVILPSSLTLGKFLICLHFRPI